MLRFYNNDFNPYGQRVWITLLEKEILHEHWEVNLFSKPRWFEKAVPNGILPTLVHEGKLLQESIDLCFFLDDLYPERPLFPSSALERYEARSLLRTFCEPAYARVYDVLKAQSAEDVHKKSAELWTFMRALGERLSQRGPFFFGDQFTIPDICLFPFVERADILLGHYRGFRLPDGKPFNAIKRFFDACANRHSVAETIAPRSVQSLKTHPFDEVDRAPYLIAVSQGYASGNIAAARARLSQKKPPLAD